MQAVIGTASSLFAAVSMLLAFSGSADSVSQAQPVLKFPLKEIDPARQQAIKDMLFINQWLWLAPKDRSRDLKESLKSKGKLQRFRIAKKDYAGDHEGLFDEQLGDDQAFAY